MSRPGSRTIDRVSATALIACTALALANLPPAELPRSWAIAWTAPAALLSLLRRFTPHLWQQALLAFVLQGSALAAVISLGDPLSRPASLASTILPPLAFVTVRQKDADAALALFLSFCVLLVGAILGGVDVVMIALYGTSAAICLRCDAHLATRNITWCPPVIAPSEGGRAVLRGGAVIALLCLFTALTIERTLALLPSPSNRPITTAAPAASTNLNRRKVGLGDSFVLDGGKGVLTDLHGEQLVRVTMVGGAPVPPGMYLRSGFFAMPGLDRWQLGALDLQSDADGDLELHRPDPRAEELWLEVERFDGASNFVFAPPDSFAVRGIDGLAVDTTREWLRQSSTGSLSPYEVGFQQLPSPADDHPFDRTAHRLGLLKLPGDFDKAPFEGLLATWQANGSPLQIANRIAEGLARHCRYDRHEPVGPHRHALQNFLFAPDNRFGYCMHFASAAALMLRLRGVPCRIGVGLYGGDVDPREPSARIYGSQHAHAWVEIPYDKRGYVVFDPTPPVERGARMPSHMAPTPDLETPTGRTRSLSEVLHDLVAFATQPWLLGVALLLAIATWRWPRNPPQPQLVEAPRSARTARRMLAKILRALAAAGLARERGQTLETFSRALHAGASLPPELEAAFSTYQQVRFGGRQFDQERELTMQRGLAAANHLATTRPGSSPSAGAGPR